MNMIIIKTMLVVLFGQIIKIIYNYLKYKKINLLDIFSSGGMPSSHSLGVMCLIMLIGRKEGFNSSIFALSFIFALVVIYDARGVRKACGDNTIAINKILKRDKIKEVLGHTNKEVLIGCILGSIIGAFI